MSIFDFFNKKHKDDDSKKDFSDSFKYEIYEFERTYNYSVEVYDMFTDESEVIEGEITFNGEVYWDDFEKVYEYELFTSESTGKFEPNEFRGHDGLEDRFLNDYKDYLLSQGVNSSMIAW